MSSPCDDRGGEQPALGGLALLVLPEDLGVVAAREADPRELGVELGDDRAEVPALDAGTDVESARVALSLYGVGVGLDRHGGHVLEPDPLAGPVGVSMGSCSRAVTFDRVSGVLHTTTS